MELPFSLIKMTRHYLHSRTFRVQINKILSTIRKMRSSIIQGSVIGPKYHNYHMNNFPIAPKGITALFADDSAIVSVDKNPSKALSNLQELIEKVETWCRLSRAELNTDKTVFMWISGKTYLPQGASICVNGTDIFPVLSTKYLGVIIDRKLSFTSHRNHVLRKADLAKYTLRKILAGKSALATKHKLHIYKMILRPTLLYAASAWLYAYPGHIIALERFQSKTIRSITNSNWFVRNRTIRAGAEMETVFDYAKKLIERFFDKMEDSEYQHIREISPYPATEIRRHHGINFKRPKNFLVMTRPEFVGN